MDFKKYNGKGLKGRFVKGNLCLANYDEVDGVWLFSDAKTDKLIAEAEDFNMTKGVKFYDETPEHENCR